MTSPQRAIIAVVAFLALWEFVGRAQMLFSALGLDLIASYLPRVQLFPPPSVVIQAFDEIRLSDLGISLWRAFGGWTIGSVVGIVVGLFTGRSEIAHSYISPIMQMFRPLPPVAMIPVVIMWFGIGEISKLFAISFAVFFSVWINTHIGAQRVPDSFVWSARTLNATPHEILFRVILPGSLPVIVAGLRNGVAIAFVMVFVSELAGASAGLGYQINASYLAYRMDRMLAALVMLGALGAAADFAVNAALLLRFPWLKYSQQK
ncbi:MAG: ABC transporter permease [Gammaproteobacteria bacterium]